MNEEDRRSLRAKAEKALGGNIADRSAFSPRPTHILHLLDQAEENDRLRSALKEARRFLDYFANDRREFSGPGTPLSCLAHIDWALNPNKTALAPDADTRIE